MDDDLRIIIMVCLFFAAIVVAVVAGVTYAVSSTYNGQKYDTVVTIQAVEHSTRWGEHTTVWVQVYGDQDITYTFVGTVNFEVGKTYHIVFIDQIWLEYYIVSTTRGAVISVEEI